MNSIDETFNYQAEATAQINGGLHMIDAVTQSNSATAEESASAAEELSNQANSLKDVISKFRV